MSRNYCDYVRFLAKEHNILYIGRNSEEIYDATSAYFASASKIDMTEELLEKMESILMKRHVSITVIDATSNDTLVEWYYHAVAKFNPEIFTLLIYDPKSYNKVFNVVPFVDAVVTAPINTEMFHKKLFTLLSRSYAINSIAKEEISFEKELPVNNSLEMFFQTYQGSALFLSDDLEDMVTELDAGNLSHEFFLHIAQKLDAIATIFSKTTQTTAVVSLFKELSGYLKNLDFQTIAVENLSDFNYLSNILTDISLYLKAMFIENTFHDVYVFQGSLQSNIGFLKASLSGIEITESNNLEFFE